MCVYKLHLAYTMSHAIKYIEKLLFYLFPNINGTKLKVYVPIESITFKGTNKLFDLVIAICSSIVAYFNEVFKCFFGFS